MKSPEEYLWSTFCAWALTIAVGTLGVSGVLAMFMHAGQAWAGTLRMLCVFSFAAVAALALANANNAAAAAMQAASHPKVHWPTLVPALVCAAGFGFSSFIGVALGWEIMTRGVTQAELPSAQAVLFGASFLAFAKPAMTWIIEGRRAMDRADANIAEAADNARVDARHRAEIDARKDATPFKPHLIRDALAAGFASLGLIGASNAAEAAPHPQQDALPQMRQGASQDASAAAAATHREAKEQAPQRHAKGASGGATRRTKDDYEARVSMARDLLLTQPKISNREVARRTELSPSKVDRLARDLTPMQRAQAA